MSRIALTSEQVAQMRQELARREMLIVEHVLQQPDYPPLPCCPECGAVVEQMETMDEPPQFAIYEQAMLINLAPCGHRFRAVAGLGSPH
ncbi:MULTISPECIES: hypothetical protein [unclassified Streptomyces]|uniref:hypothetical protein n=1 Tax=unclassified Streptomyces TaxID=2593676 RepID=UPI000DDBA2C0|nr:MULTISPECIES: hypothetical protein [unclassified Streptomyces]QZZ26538.1 hypothetical protein A7X85_09970 [Streptomyces sp. ST1015]